MTHRRFALLLAVLLFTLASGGCTRYVKTSQGRKAIEKTQRQLQKADATMTADAREKALILLTLRRDGADLGKAPYVGLAQQIAALATIRKDLKPIATAVNQLAGAYKRTVFKSKKVRSTEKKKWDAIQRIRNQMMAQGRAAKGVVQRYQSASKNVAKTAKRHQIGKVQTGPIRKKLRKFLNRIGPQLQDARQKVAKSEALLQGSLSQWSAEKLRTKQTILNQMKTQLNQIEAASGRMRTGQQTFNKLAGNQKTVWTGPGTQTFAMLKRLEADGKHVKKAAATLRKLEVQLRKR